MIKNDERRIITPLNSTFMLTSIIGFLASAFWVPTLTFKNSISYAFAFGIVFLVMFISSIISMTYSPLSEHLQIDEKRRIKL
jgi:hypothetical protein